LATSDINCWANCGCLEDRHRLFSNCDLFGWLWPMISDWLGFSTALHGNL